MIDASGSMLDAAREHPAAPRDARAGAGRIIWRVWATSCLLILTVASAGAQSTRNVLALHNENANHPASIIFSTVLRRSFGADPHNQLFEEYLDEHRLPTGDSTWMTVLRKKYGDKKLDLIITDGQAPLTFMLRHAAELWPGTPIVFTYLQRSELPRKLPENVTGVVMTVDYRATLELALRLTPNTRHVFYVGSTRPDDASWDGFAREGFSAVGAAIDVTYLDDLSLSDLMARLGALPDSSVVIYGGLYQDAEGHTYVPGRVCPVVAAASRVPVYGIASTYIGCGIVGGVVIDFETVLEQTAQLALHVFRRGSAAGVPIEPSSSPTILDWRQLNRWRVDPNLVPADADVRFRPPALWQQYRWLVLGVLGILAGLVGIVIVLLTERHRRRQANLLIETLTGRLITAAEGERQRIARDLHDDVVQQLSLVISNISARVDDRVNGERNGVPPLNDQVRILSETLESVRDLSHHLHSSKLELLGLSAALRDLARRVATQHEVSVEFIASHMPPLSPDRSLCFYRVAQEALRNALTHSASRRVELSLVADADIVRLRVQDHGRGFNIDTPQYGLGLVTMRERLKMVGGRLHIHSTPDAGTEVVAEAPVG